MRGLAKTSREYGRMEPVDRRRPAPAADEAFEAFPAGETCKPVFDASVRRA